MKELNFEVIGKKLREIRISRGLTQEYIANMADVNTSHISNIENNRVKISLTTLVHICNALDVTVDYVLSSEYTVSSPIDNEILKEIHQLTNDNKEKILQIIKILE